MLIVRSQNNVPIRLTEERWKHISQSHPEMADLRDCVLETHGLLGHAACCLEGNDMETLRILDRPERIEWDYDEEADVLYLSVGAPRPVTGVDIGEGVVVRFDEQRKEVVGLTVLGLRTRLLRGLTTP